MGSGGGGRCVGLWKKPWGRLGKKGLR
jgi:hypothetical protein